MQNMLAYEMKKIDDSIKEDKLTDYQRIKRQLRDTKGSEKDVEMKLFEKKQRFFTSNFKSYSRDKRNDIFSNKTNPPPVGQYHPKKEVTQHKARSSHFDPHHKESILAQKLKFDLAKANVKINPRILKHMSV